MSFFCSSFNWFDGILKGNPSSVLRTVIQFIFLLISAEIKMNCFIIGIITEVLLIARVVTSTNERCNALVSNTCIQRCADASCKCDAVYGDLKFTICNQACHGPKCKTVTCSSGVCHQKCHNCHMECTSDVDYCSQWCLSGACSFTCNARQCKQECNGKECKVPVNAVTCQTIYPHFYLVILAGLFASTSILSFLLIVISCRETKNNWNMRIRFDKGARYVKIHSVSSSIESLYSQEAEAAWWMCCVTHVASSVLLPLPLHKQPHNWKIIALLLWNNVNRVYSFRMKGLCYKDKRFCGMKELATQTTDCDKVNFVTLIYTNELPQVWGKKKNSGQYTLMNVSSDKMLSPVTLAR